MIPSSLRPNPLRLLSKCAAAAGLVAMTHLAFGATAAANFSITSFAYQANGGTLTWDPSNDYQTMTAWSADAGGIADYQTNTRTYPVVTTDAFVTTTGQASSNVGASASRTISGYAGATTSSYSLTAQPNKASSEAIQSGTFTLTGGTGTVTFNIGYTISLSAPGGNAYDTFSNANLAFTLGTYDGVTGGTANVDRYSFDTASGVATYSGTLTETVTFADAGDIGYYNLQGDAFASASALAVPEPSEWALMLAGLGAVGTTAYRRRHRAEG